MSIRIGDWEFDHHHYDAEADVMYLSIGPPVEGESEETPEGHFLRFDESGRFRGVTLIDAGRIQDEDGTIYVTLPQRNAVRLPRPLEPA